MSRTLDRAALLRELGFGHSEALDRAVEVLVAAGLTTPRKTGIAAGKRRLVLEALSGALVRLCPRCRSGARRLDGREPVPVSRPAECERCGGSANRLAVDRAAVACRRSRVHRVVVVGGSPGVHAALSELWPSDIELRIVPGTVRIESRRARSALDGADVVLIWGTSELDHKVSVHYTKTRSAKVVIARRRGVAALMERLVAHLESR